MHALSKFKSSITQWCVTRSDRLNTTRITNNYFMLEGDIYDIYLCHELNPCLLKATSRKLEITLAVRADVLGTGGYRLVLTD